MQRIKRLEAGDSSQARGMDTQAMLPVLAMVAELIAMLGFRWVSVPDLRYSPYAQAGMLWKLEETAKGIAWNYQVPEAMTRAADQAAGYLRIGMAVSVILGLCFILQAFRVKVKAKRLGRLAFLWNTGMTAAVLWWATDTNMALNLLEGRENNFMNLTIYSHVQLTAAALPADRAGTSDRPVSGETSGYPEGVCSGILPDQNRDERYGDREADDPCLCPDPDSNPGGDLFRDLLSE